MDDRSFLPARTWQLARDLLASPQRALARLHGESALYDALRLYALFMITAVLFYTFKPVDFPPPDAMSMPLSLGSQKGLFFWAKVHAWDPLLAAVWVAFLAWFCSLFQSERLNKLIDALNAVELKALGPLLSSFLISFVIRFIPFFLIVLIVLALALVPLAPILLYTNNYISKPMFLLLWVLLLAGMIPRLRALDRKLWTPLTSMILSLSVVNLALLPLFCSGVLLRSAIAYTILEFVMVIWTLGLGTYLLSRIAQVPLPRACAALFLSMLCQAWFIFALHLLGLVPKEILKALMSV